MSNITKKIVATITALTVSVWLVGPGTAEALTSAELQAQIDALLAQIAALQTQLSSQTGTGTGTAITACTGVTSFTRNLTLGSSGTDVKCLQGILNTAADTQVAASGVGSSGNETLYFGNLTKSGVVKFQNKYAAEVLTPIGLTAGTGFVGAQTRAKLNALLSTTPAPTPTPSPTPTPTPGTSPTPTPLPTASGLTIAVASDNPASATIISDGTAGAAGSQALIPVLKLDFSTPAGTSAKVTTLKLKRLGVSTDTDVPNAYLYDGDTKLAELSSLSSGVLTFTDSAGLFTVSEAKSITVKFDLHKDSSSGKTIGFGLIAAADVTTDAAAVNATFPMNGNLMTVATVTDFGRVQVTTSTNAATVDPGTNGFEAFRFTVQSSNQKIDIYKIRFRQIGSIATADIANLKLTAGGTQIGSTAASLGADGYVTFDMSAAPYQINSGTTKTFSLTLDVVKGSTRTIQFSIPKSTDIVAKDNNYAVFVAPDSGTIGSWSAQDSQQVSVNSGSLIISRRSDSPSGNIALSKTNVTLATYDVKATGEDIKVTSLVYRLTPEDTAWEDLKNAQVIIDGLQRGTTQVTVASNTDYTATTNYTFPAGVTKTLEIRADIVAASASGATLAANDTVKALVVASTSVLNAERQVSLTNFAFPSADQNGNSLTISASALSSDKNNSVGNIQAVFSNTGVTIGSYIITAGAAEGIDINKFVFEGSSSTDATATAANNSLGEAFSNLKLYQGTTQLGVTVVPSTSDAGGTDYTFNLSPNLSLAAGDSVTVTLKADVLASGVVDWSNGDDVALLTVEGTGKVTGNTVTDSDGAGGQQVSLSTSGSIALAKDSSTPGTTMVALGDSAVTLGVWRISQPNSVESLTLTQAYVITATGSATSSGNVKNLKLYCDQGGQAGTTQFGSTKDALLPNSAASGYYAVFNGSCAIPAGGYRLISLKGDLVDYASGPYPTGGTITSGGDWAQFYMELPSSITGVATDYVIATGAGGAYASSTNSSSSANKVYPYRTKLGASVACNGSCTKSRATSDKIAKLTLTGSASADAQFRANLAQVNDDSTDQWLWASTAPASGDGSFSQIDFVASTTSKVDGTGSVYLSVMASGAASSTWAAQIYGDVANYSKLSMWIFPENNASSTEGQIFFSAAGNATDTIDAWASSTAQVAVVGLASNTWNFVTVDIPDTVAAAADVISIVGYMFRAPDGATVSAAIDAVRAYNDSINIDISGNTSGSATGTAFTLQKTDGTQVATGYLSTNATVTLIPSTGSETGNEAVIEASASGVVLELVANTQTLMNDDTTANESLGISLDFGTPDSAGDFRWYDQAVDQTNPITWVYGSTPISITNVY